MPNVHFGGSDGGAHCGVICDVSLPTYNLSFWAGIAPAVQNCRWSS